MENGADDRKEREGILSRKGNGRCNRENMTVG